MHFGKDNYKTPRTDFPLLAGAAVLTLFAAALIYAPPSHWLSMLG